MKVLEQRILSDGKVFPGNVLKVNSFLNHQLDVELLDEMGAEIRRLFDGESVSKILTIETSGIAIACAAARHFGVPVLFAKKEKTSNLSDNNYETKVASFTHGNVCTVVCSKDFLHKDDKVLIIDDFIADGNALIGLIDICNQAGAEIVGCVGAIEKVFQGGGDKVRAMGYRVEALARIKSMSDDSLEFC